MQWARETRELRQGVFHLVEWNYDQYEGVTLKQIHEGARRAGRSSAMDDTASRRFSWVRMDRARAPGRCGRWRRGAIRLGDVPHVFATRWIGLPAGACYYRNIPG